MLTCDVSMSPALAVGQPRDEFSQWVALPEEVLAGACEEFLQWRQEDAELRRENAELKQLAGYWKAMHARAVQREAKLTEEIQAARGEIRQLQDKLFGRKSERAGRRDRSNQLEDPQEPAKPARRRGQQPGRRDYVLICRPSKSSSSCRKTNTVARSAASRGGRCPIPKTPNSSRSKSELIAG